MLPRISSSYTCRYWRSGKRGEGALTPFPINVHEPILTISSAETEIIKTYIVTLEYKTYLLRISVYMGLNILSLLFNLFGNDKR